MIKGRGRIRDFGCGGKAYGKLVSKKNCMSFRCESCNHMQYESKNSMNRSSMKKCDLCGGYLEFTKAASKKMTPNVKKDTNEKICSCGNKLSSFNKNNICFSCVEKGRELRRGVYNV